MYYFYFILKEISCENSEDFVNQLIYQIKKSIKYDKTLNKAKISFITNELNEHIIYQICYLYHKNQDIENNEL